MKKIFTLVICAVASLSAFALEQQLLASPQSLDTEETGWFPGICIEKAPFLTAKPGTELVIDYTLNDGVDSHSFKLATAYGGTLLPGFEGNSGENNANLDVTENGRYRYTITQETIDLLNNNDAIGWDGFVRICGTGLTIDKAYLLISDSESLAQCPVDLEWWPGIEINAGVITSAEPGWRIVMDYEVTGEGGEGGFSFTTKYGGVNVPGFDGNKMDGERSVMSVTENGVYTYIINEDAIAKLKDVDFTGYDGLRIVGQGIKVTGLSLVRSQDPSSGIDDVTAVDDNDAPVEFYNLHGVKTTNPSAGIYIKRQGHKVSKVVIR